MQPDYVLAYDIAYGYDTAGFHGLGLLLNTRELPTCRMLRNFGGIALAYAPLQYIRADRLIQ